MVEMEPRLHISHHLKKPLVPGMDSICLSYWPNGSRGNQQTTQAMAKAVGCSPQTDGKKTPLLKTTLTQLIEPLLTSVHSTGRFSVHDRRTKVKNNSVGENQTLLTVLLKYSHKMTPNDIRLHS